MITIICLPISIYIDENKNVSSLIRFFFPGLFIMCVQLYGFKNMFIIMVNINENLRTLLRGFDLIGFIQKLVQGNYINEFTVIEYVYTCACSFFKLKTSLNSFPTDLYGV